MTTLVIQLLLLGLSTVCNVAYAKSPRKIIGGSEAVSIPYQVSIQRQGEHFCGGTILDSRHILTAAHCIVDDDGNRDSSRLDVIIGTTDKNDRKSGNVFQISRSRVHVNYNASDSRKNDIAVLKMAKTMTFDSGYRLIRLPIDDTSVGTKVTSSGWGATQWSDINQEGDAYPRYLRYYDAEVIDQKKCQRMMTPITIHPEHICVWAKGRSITCQGDSGGPLTDKNFIIGISSFNKNCNSFYPDIYTRVYKYVNWIRNILNE